jgi:hypothetical protein
LSLLVAVAVVEQGTSAQVVAELADLEQELD